MKMEGKPNLQKIWQEVNVSVLKNNPNDRKKTVGGKIK